MTDSAESLIRSVLGTEAHDTTRLSGNRWSEVWSVRSRSAPEIVIKIGQPEVIEEERFGLECLRETRTVRIPEFIGIETIAGHGMLMLESLEAGGAPDWSCFGRELAQLHQVDVGVLFGFMIDNHLGGTPQKNTWHDDWPRFNQACRHGPLLDSLTLDPDDHSLIDSALGAFAECLNPARPSLIHGDLWSGNALALTDGSVALIDPAPSYSDALADLAMMQLFGGFPDCFFESYLVESGLSLKPRRLAAYRLYHAMNHLLLFGEGYLQLVRSEARQVLSADP